MQIKKKNGSLEAFNGEKIRVAVGKTMQRTVSKLSDAQLNNVVKCVEVLVADRDIVDVEDIHGAVINAIRLYNKEVADTYESYHEYRKNDAAAWERARQQANETIFVGDRENANFDSTLNSTKGSLVRGYVTKELYIRHHLSQEEQRGTKEGQIYIHDMRDLIFRGINCCLFDMETLLKGGFEMAGMRYEEPKSLLSALQVIGDVTLVATAQQFGGFTVPEIDRILVPYYLKSVARHREVANRYGIEYPSLYAKEMVDRELKQGLQSFEMKVNSVPSSRGDTAFTTITFGNVQSENAEEVSAQLDIAECILNTRMYGQGDRAPVVFPKLVYLHSQKQHDREPGLQFLFRKAIECSSKAMYPDFLSLDAGSLGEIFERTGKAVSPMGCRAFLSEWKDESGESHFIGRANIGAVSLNLPMIWQDAGGCEETFFCELDHWLTVTRNFFKRRYADIAANKASTNPLAFTQGGLLGGYRKPDEPIGDIVNTFTASFGITSLNELSVLMFGAGLDDIQDFEREKLHNVIDYTQGRIDEFKAEDGYLYALYGTPAESLAGTQLRQFRDKYGRIGGVSDREYFTNSFHCHVSASLTPSAKQDEEYELFHRIKGGRIQYVRIDNPNNLRAISEIVKRGMRMGFYQGVNFRLAVCRCGNRPHSWKEGDSCAACGSDEFTVIDRTCGYLGYSKVRGNNRFNDSKQAEIADRVSM